MLLSNLGSAALQQNCSEVLLMDNLCCAFVGAIITELTQCRPICYHRTQLQYLALQMRIHAMSR